MSSSKRYVFLVLTGALFSMSIFNCANNDLLTKDEGCEKQEEYTPLPWETDWLTPISLLKTVFLLFAETHNSICSIQPKPFFRAYFFSLVFYSLHTIVAYIPLLTDLYRGHNSASTPLTIEVSRYFVYVILIPSGWIIKETLVASVVYYLVTRKKISLRLTAKICCYASIFILIYWIPIISDLNLPIKGFLIGAAVGARHGVGISRMLLASTIICVVLTLISYLPIRQLLTYF